MIVVLQPHSAGSAGTDSGMDEQQRVVAAMMMQLHGCRCCWPVACSCCCGVRDSRSRVWN